jgi:hypothetical protein
MLHRRGSEEAGIREVGEMSAEKTVLKVPLEGVGTFGAANAGGTEVKDVNTYSTKLRHTRRENEFVMGRCRTGGRITVLLDYRIVLWKAKPAHNVPIDNIRIKSY